MDFFIKIHQKRKIKYTPNQTKNSQNFIFMYNSPEGKNNSLEKMLITPLL